MQYYSFCGYPTMPVALFLLFLSALGCSNANDRREQVNEPSSLDASEGGDGPAYGWAGQPWNSGERLDAGLTRESADASETGPSDGNTYGNPEDVQVARDTGIDDKPMEQNNDSGSSTPSLRLPPENGGFDYQIGGAYPPSTAVGIVSRDKDDPPAAGLYNICYINGFQTQSDEAQFWLEQHPDLVLRNLSTGDPIIDSDWGEMLLDISTDEKRTKIGSIVGDWIVQCAEKGFDAIEVDNLDAYTRSGGRLSQSQAIAFIQLLADRAHAEGLAIAQKNAAELTVFKEEMGTDFVVAEECDYFEECDLYTSVYENQVLVIEYPHSASDDNGVYDQSDFDDFCDRYPQLSIVFRDLSVSPSNHPRYVYAGC